MTKKSKPKIIVIVGPTASGKTGLSIEIAEQFNGEVISADSRQVYRGLNIGTEKITPDEMCGVPHHLIDVADPSVVFNADDFKREASAAITDIVDREHLPIIAGGTFFYVDVLLDNIKLPNVPPDPKLREHLSELSAETLYEQLQQRDPERAFSIDPQNKRRLIRALEVVHSLGTVPKFESGTRTSKTQYDMLKIGIKTDREELRERIRARAEEALERGLIEETQQLLKNGITHERLSEIGLEYRIVLEYLDGDLTDEELIQKIEEKNWQYAKRQLMWLKRDEQIEWFERSDGDLSACSAQAEAIAARVAEFLS